MTDIEIFILVSSAVLGVLTFTYRYLSNDRISRKTQQEVAWPATTDNVSKTLEAKDEARHAACANEYLSTVERDGKTVWDVHNDDLSWKYRDRRGPRD